MALSDWEKLAITKRKIDMRRAEQWLVNIWPRYYSDEEKKLSKKRKIEIIKKYWLNEEIV